MHTLAVVDSDPSNCHLLGEIAAACGWDMVGCAHNASDGAALVSRTRPDCLVTDYWFGEGETGLDLIARAKADLPDIHTVVFTGWNLRDVVEMAGECRPDNLLRKPGPTQALMDVLRDLAAHSPRMSMRVLG